MLKTEESLHKSSDRMDDNRTDIKFKQYWLNKYDTISRLRVARPCLDICHVFLWRLFTMLYALINLVYEHLGIVKLSIRTS